ncbi:hypothetical protein C8J56DRAFT_930673 [Mycena floridula]|nr:hypothetical protein C8J56DRAFT_930673 [Mycena floridula]
MSLLTNQKRKFTRPPGSMPDFCLDKLSPKADFGSGQKRRKNSKTDQAFSTIVQGPRTCINHQKISDFLSSWSSPTHSAHQFFHLISFFFHLSIMRLLLIAIPLSLGIAAAAYPASSATLERRDDSDCYVQRAQSTCDPSKCTVRCVEQDGNCKPTQSFGNVGGACSGCVCRSREKERARKKHKNGLKKMKIDRIIDKY